MLMLGGIVQADIVLSMSHIISSAHRFKALCCSLCSANYLLIQFISSKYVGEKYESQVVVFFIYFFYKKQRE